MKASGDGCYMANAFVAIHSQLIARSLHEDAVHMACRNEVLFVDTILTIYVVVEMCKWLTVVS